MISDHCCINLFLLHVLVVPVDENVSSICLLQWRSISGLPARSTVVQHWAGTSQSRLKDRELSMSSLRNDQMPPGGGDARVFSPSAFSLDTLASKHRMWASSLKGLSLYSSRSHSLSCEETVESHKNATFSRCMLSLSSFYVSLFNTQCQEVHLIRLCGLKLLELLLETKVGACAGSHHLHSSQYFLPAHPRHRHDVSYHQSDTARNACQTVK